MVLDRDKYNETIVVGEITYTLSRQAIDMMVERGIEKHQILEVLTNWVARELNSEHKSTGYFGFVPGGSQLLMVAVSESYHTKTTVHFYRTATRHYHRGNYTYLNGVNHEPESSI